MLVYRSRRRVVKRLIRAIIAKELTIHSSTELFRLKAIKDLLTVAMEKPVDPRLIEAALKIYSYQLIIAQAYLEDALVNIRTNIRRLNKK